MSERAQALEAVLERTALKRVEQYRIDGYQNLADAVWGFWYDTVRQVIRGQPLAAPPVGVSPQPERTQCDYCHTWRSQPCGEGCAWQPASLSPVEPTPEPPPDAQVCVWREREWDYESGCRGTQISRDERSSGPPDGWKHCPYCGKRLVVGTAPQGGEQ